MTDDAKQHGRPRFLSKSRWKRSSNDEQGQDFQLNADVQDFLKPSTTNTRSVSPKAPRIDVAAAQRWSGNNPELRTGNAFQDPFSTQGGGKRERKAMRKNLVVKFVLTAPEVIGEGGDEAEAPAIEISRAKLARGAAVSNDPKRSRASPKWFGDQLNPDRADMHPGFGQEQPRTSVEKIRFPSPQPPPRRSNTKVSHALPDEDTDIDPKPLMRTGTSWSDYNEQHHSPPDDEEDSDGELSVLSPNRPGVARSESKLSYHLPEFKSVIENSPIELANHRNSFLEARPRDRNSLSAQLQHLMREGEGKALHEAFRNPIPEPADDVSRNSTSTTSSYKPYSPVDAPVPAFSSATASRLIAPQPQTSALSSGNSSRNITPKVPSPSILPSADPTPAAQPRAAMPLRKPLPAMRASENLAEQPQNSTPPSLGRPAPQQPLIASQDFAKPPSRGQDSPLPPLVIPRTDAQPGPQTASTLPTASSASSSSGYAQAAYEDFVERCSHMPGIFRLQAEYELPTSAFTPNEWLRCAVWWFLKGRAGMESIIRNRPRSADGRPMSRDQQLLLMQPHVDLAKACWILSDVFPTHPGVRPSSDPSFGFKAAVAREAGDGATADMFESAETLLSNIKALISSISRNGAMPPSHALIQGQDQTIWVRYPKISPNVIAIFSGNVSRGITDSGPARQFNPLSIMAVADTKTDFSYCRTFANATLSSQDSNAERISLPCLVSTMRPRNDWNPKVTICTQKELVSVCISGDRTVGPSWEEVRWSEEHCLLHVKLAHGYCLDVQLTEPDFKQIWNTYNHSYNVQASLMPQKDERMVFEVGLRECQYKDARQPPTFPTDRVKRCRVRLFTRSEIRVEGTGQRRFYRGHRLLVVTSPKNRMLGTTSHDLGTRCPTFIEMGIDPGNDGAAAMKMIFNDSSRQSSLYMVFMEPKDQQALYRILNDMDVSIDETQYANIRLSTLAIEPASTIVSPSHDPSPLYGMKWQAVSVINADPQSPEHETARTVLSDCLRTVAQAADGTLTDRINVGPGELQIRLPVSGNSELTVLRNAQDDLSLTVDTSRCRILPDSLLELMRTITAQPTIRTYSFLSLPDLHAFQKSVTGFTVKFDGVASSFVIARRRPTGMLSLHKRLEAGSTRIQVVSDETAKVTQLLAFFEEFQHADSLGFVLKGVDVFEKTELKGEKGGGGRFGVKLVDAKFSLPLEAKKGKDGGGEMGAVQRKFVCLDMPEYPREDDDVTIGFDDERGAFSRQTASAWLNTNVLAEREHFLAVLPAPPQASRGLTIRRRV